MNENERYLIHTDGGARGNPGPAAAGYVIEGPGLAPVRHGDYLGVTTNNVAEYAAAINALSRLRDLLGAQKASQAAVTVHADSELLVKQVNGLYKVKNPNLGQLFLQLHNIRQSFASVTFRHVRREQNTGADRMVNKVLDEKAEQGN